ncbi:MAG TPA: trehalose-phosphatase [Candidatus Binatia bacterium]|nr:trehalose-phosphatase [Candidatus Binatia bacterium]
MSESSRSTDVAPAHALALAREALSAVPAGLLADFDGTLSPIVSDPMRSRLVDGAHAALAALAERLAVVAIVTGRAPLDARRMAGVPGVFIAGNHGTEWLEPGSDAPIVAPEAAGMRAAIEDAIARLPRLEGIAVEDKGSSASVHFRNAPDPDAALAAIEHALRGIEEHGLRIGHGRMVVELRPVGLGDKGTAARGIVERFGLRGVVVLGDDITDLDMFRAVSDLRRAGSVRAAIIGVGGAGGEVPPEVAEATDVVLGGPADAAALLARL